MRTLGLLVLLSGLLAGCTMLAPAPAPTAERGPAGPREPIRTARVQRGDISGVLRLSGEVRAKGQQSLTSRVSGRLEKLYVDLGDNVQEGQPVAELDRTTFELRVVQGEAALATAEAQYAGLLLGARPDEAAQAEAILRAAQARLQAIESAPRGDSPEQLLANLQARRQRVAELELAAAVAQAQAIAQSEVNLNAARTRLDQLQREANPNQTAIVAARQSVLQSEEALVRARRPTVSTELQQARQELYSAQDQLILSRGAVSQADLEAARAAVQAAEIGARRAGTPPTEVELKMAEARSRKAQAELEVARFEAREATVVSPLSGQVGEVLASPGALVAPGTPLLTVIPPTFELVVAVPDSQLGQVGIGQPVKVGVDAYPDQDFNGAVKTMAPAVDPRTRSVAIRVEVSDPGFKLKAGMFAQLAVSAPTRRGALLVPKEAVVGSGPEQLVYLVVDGRARRQPVQVSAADGRNVEILAGLAEGAEVVISPAGQVDGAPTR